MSIEKANFRAIEAEVIRLFRHQEGSRTHGRGNIRR